MKIELRGVSLAPALGTRIEKLPGQGPGEPALLVHGEHVGGAQDLFRGIATTLLWPPVFEYLAGH